MPLVIDEERIKSLLNECPPQSCSINICDIQAMDFLRCSESTMLPSNVGSTIPQAVPMLSAEEAKARLLFFRNRIVQSGGLLDEEALQQQIDEIKGRV